MSMSAFQKTAWVFWHTGIVRDRPESVLYLSVETCVQLVTLASRSAAVGVPELGATIRSRSRLGPPEAPVAVARTLLPPATRLALTVTVAQVSQFAVGLKAREVATAVPLTAMVIGRLT